MDLAALGAEFKSPFGPSGGAIVLCWKEETEVVKVRFTARETETEVVYLDVSLKRIRGRGQRLTK